jgi:hypothetical protein
MRKIKDWFDKQIIELLDLCLGIKNNNYITVASFSNLLGDYVYNRCKYIYETHYAEIELKEGN